MLQKKCFFTKMVVLCPSGKQRHYAECVCVFVSPSYIVLASYWCETKVYFFVCKTDTIKTQSGLCNVVATFAIL